MGRHNNNHNDSTLYDYERCEFIIAIFQKQRPCGSPRRADAGDIKDAKNISWLQKLPRRDCQWAWRSLNPQY